MFVENQDKTLDFYKKLNFGVHTDSSFGEFRWLTLCLPGNKNLELALIKAESTQEKNLVGKQAAQKPFLSIDTDNCQQDFQRLKDLGVEFVQEPKSEEWGTSAMFKDLYGNLIYLNQSNI